MARKIPAPYTYLAILVILILLGIFFNTVLPKETLEKIQHLLYGPFQGLVTTLWWAAMLFSIGMLALVLSVRQRR